MIRYRVRRHEQSPRHTYGRILRADNSLVGVILERPWVDADKNGKRDRNVSRFAPGLYTCFRRKSHKNGGTGKRDYDVWEFKGVPDCDHAQIHRAAHVSDLNGCMGIGEQFGPRTDPVTKELLPGIVGSPSAFDRFMKETAEYDEIEVLVEDAFDD